MNLLSIFGKQAIKIVQHLVDESEIDDLPDDEKENYDPSISPTMFSNLKIDLNKIFLKNDIID
ncbi:MAG: hypothetical protein FWC47_01725 [Oscillospiraceae bacterium]|nr:hypothetical protein [Oscillospiraceae bacterium]